MVDNTDLNLFIFLKINLPKKHLQYVAGSISLLSHVKHYNIDTESSYN